MKERPAALTADPSGANALTVAPKLSFYKPNSPQKYMRNRVTGAAAALTAAARAQTLAELRAHLTALTFGSPYLSAAEQLRANHHAHECENPAQLRRWLANTRAELARRALAEQHGTTVSDTLASSRDQQAATFFQPADSLTFAALVSQFIPQSNA